MKISIYITYFNMFFFYSFITNSIILPLSVQMCYWTGKKLQVLRYHPFADNLGNNSNFSPSKKSFFLFPNIFPPPKKKLHLENRMVLVHCSSGYLLNQRKRAVLWDHLCWTSETDRFYEVTFLNQRKRPVLWDHLCMDVCMDVWM